MKLFQNKSRRTIARVIGFLLLSSLIVCAVYVHFNDYFYIVKQAKYDSPRCPLLSSRPQPLTNATVSAVPGKNISIFNYQIEIPCSDVDGTVQFPHLKRIHCANGNGFTFYDPDFYKTWTTYDSAVNSLNSLPSQINIFHSHRANSHVLLLLNEKTNLALMAKGHIYRINLSNVRGFQFGDGSGIFETKFALFDKQNRYIRFSIGSDKPITQDQINRMLQSIKRVSDLPDATFDRASTGSAK
jgi:hypothetical protein